MEMLYDRLNGMYPRRWRESFRDDSDIESWARAWAGTFDKRGITTAMIKRALDNCEEMFDHPPTITQFLKACTTPGRDEPVAPFDNPALAYEAKFNPELAAKAADAVKRVEDHTDHTAWIRRVLNKGQQKVSPMTWKMAQDAAREFGIPV